MTGRLRPRPARPGSGPVHLLVDSTGLKLGGLRMISEHGRRHWQKTSGYHWRALVEAHISRFKQVNGDGLRSRTDRRRETELALAVGILNRMLELGRPKYVRLA